MQVPRARDLIRNYQVAPSVGSLAFFVYFKIRRSKARRNRIQFRIVITYWNFALSQLKHTRSRLWQCQQALQPMKNVKSNSFGWWYDKLISSMENKENSLVSCVTWSLKATYTQYHASKSYWAGLGSREDSLAWKPQITTYTDREWKVVQEIKKQITSFSELSTPTGKSLDHLEIYSQRNKEKAPLSKQHSSHQTTPSRTHRSSSLMPE